MTTLIMSSRTETGARRDILLEARVNAGTKDIDNARRRGRALRAATDVPTLPVVITVNSTQEGIHYARGIYSFTKNQHWDIPIPSPAYQQDNAHVEIITFDPGGEFHQLRQSLPT